MIRKFFSLKLKIIYLNKCKTQSHLTKRQSFSFLSNSTFTVIDGNQYYLNVRVKMSFKLNATLNSSYSVPNNHLTKCIQLCLVNADLANSNSFLFAFSATVQIFQDRGDQDSAQMGQKPISSARRISTSQVKFQIP